MKGTELFSLPPLRFCGASSCSCIARHCERDDPSCRLQRFYNHNSGLVAYRPPCALATACSLYSPALCASFQPRHRGRMTLTARAILCAPTVAIFYQTESSPILCRQIAHSFWFMALTLILTHTFNICTVFVHFVD